MVAEDLKANQDAVDLALFLEARLDEYVKERNLRAIDVFMGVHNFHKLITMGIAKAWSPGVPEEKTYRMADLTFRGAMRDLRSRLPDRVLVSPGGPQREQLAKKTSGRLQRRKRL